MLHKLWTVVYGLKEGGDEMLKLDDVYKRQEDNWVSRFILDEVMIMPLCRSEEDMQYIYSISNETGSRLWQLLDGEHSVRNIQEVLKSEYQGQGEVIEREVLEFLGDLIEAKLIQKVNNGAKRKNQNRASTIQHSDKKKPYKSPEIAKVRMQPEQAVLSCCISIYQPKVCTSETATSNNANICTKVTDPPWDCYTEETGFIDATLS